MRNLDNEPLVTLWRPELLTDEEIHECLKETCWTARRAAYYVLGFKISNLDSLEEEKRLCPDFEKYYELFENCFEEGRIAVHSFGSEYGKNVQTALPVDWLKLVHKGRLKDDAIDDKEVK